jgi:glycosyltransferase involved in cell wall biosynthesis
MIVTTHTGARAYEARGVPSERILVAPNGVDVNRFAVAESKESIRSSLGLPNNKTIVAYSGHLYKEKEDRKIKKIFLIKNVLKAPESQLSMSEIKNVK